VVSAARSVMARVAMLLLLLLVGPLLTAAHNLAYGSTLAFLPQTPDLPGNFPLPPRDLLRVLSDGEVAATLREQVAGLLMLSPLSSQAAVPLAFLLLVRAVQAVATAALAVALLRRRWSLLALILAGVGFLAPHLFIQVYVYYPRHVVAGYLSLAFAALALSAGAGGADLRDEPASPGDAAGKGGRANHAAKIRKASANRR
jgi:hypothetical protein